MTFWNSTPTIFRVCSNNFQKYSEQTQKKYRRTKIVAGITLYIIGIWIQLLLRTSVVRWLVLFFLFFSVRYSNQVRFYVYVLELLLIWVFHIHFLKQFNWFVWFLYSFISKFKLKWLCASHCRPFKMRFVEFINEGQLIKMLKHSKLMCYEFDRKFHLKESYWL